MATLAPPPRKAAADAADRTMLELFTAPAAVAGRSRIDLSVPDIHCAGCIRSIENAVRALPGITHARVNFTTRRLSAEWQAGTTSAAEVVAAVEGAGFAARPFRPSDATAAGHEDPKSRQLLKAMAVAGFATMNIMLLSVSVWAGADGATRDLFHLLSALIAIPAIAYAGRPFFASAWGALRQGRTNMDVPISIGLLLATAMSLWETLNSADHAWFDAAVMLTFFLLVGRYLDSVMRDRARAGVASLMKQAAPGALVRHPDGRQEWRPVETLAPGMTVMVAAGERFPVDGLVAEGASSVDRALVTGESLPEPVAAGAAVLTGTLNLDGPLAVRATAVGEASFLADMVRMMEAAEGGRARYVRIADRAARWYAPVVHLTALFTAIGWLLAGAGLHQALITAIAVLIITCPCALGLAVPAVQVRAASLLMQRGILVKDGAALERMAECDTLLFDKTGTLTLGRPVPVGTLPLAADDLALAAGLAAASRHPLSRALHAEARRLGVVPAAFARIDEVPGAGLEGWADGLRVRLGRADWVGSDARNTADSRYLELAFRRGEETPVRIAFADPLRPDAAEVVGWARSRGMALSILSGDRPAAVARVADDLGIADWRAAATPAEKLAFVQALTAAGRRVLVVGDGLNDAPMLAAGHASLAPATASDAGQTAADMIFLGDSLMAVAQALDLAKRSGHHIRQNFVAAIAYNILAVPIAIAGLATPLIAAVAMSASSILVVGNALRLRSRL